MNILILSWRGLGHPNAGGAEIATHEHAKAWVRAGHDVTLFTSSFSGAMVRETIDGVEIIRYGNQVIGVHLAVFFWFIFGKHPKFDIVVDEFHGIPFFTPLFVKTKILAYIHEAALEVWKTNELRKPFNTIASVIGPVMEPLFFKLYTKVDFMTVSNSTKNDLIDFGVPREKIKVIFNGITFVDTKKYKREKQIISLGALSSDKGTPDSIKLLSELLRKDVDWKLVIVGKGNPDFVEKLKRMAKEFEISKNVVFKGFVSEKYKFELLSKSFCLVNLSIHEGWGLVNIESNCMGTPVFAYKVKGVTDSVLDKKTGILVEKGDTHQMAIEIVKLYSDNIRYEEFSEKCRKWGKSFSWEKSTRESTLLIEKL